MLSRRPGDPPIGPPLERELSRLGIVSIILNKNRNIDHSFLFTFSSAKIRHIDLNEMFSSISLSSTAISEKDNNDYSLLKDDEISHQQSTKYSESLKHQQTSIKHDQFTVSNRSRRKSSDINGANDSSMNDPAYIKGIMITAIRMYYHYHGCNYLC